VQAAFAERYADLGEVYAIIAAGSSRIGTASRDHWRHALDLYQRSAATWQDLLERGLLAEVNAGELDAVNREIARCESAARP
jgi:hypothetical protein